MDLKQLEYIVKISEEGNITKASQKLFISQPALNQQLLKLENDLGVPLFNRNKNNLTLTYAGEIYIENANKILNIKKDTYKMISDISNSNKGKISVGFTPERGSDMFSYIYPKFHKRYPNISINPIENKSNDLENLVSNGTLDIAFTSLPNSSYSNNPKIHLLNEKLVLIISKKNQLCEELLSSSYKDGFIDISLLKSENFIMLKKDSTLREIIDDTLFKYNFHPNILLESSSTYTVTNMVKNNLGYSIVPFYYAKNNPDLMYFNLGSYPSWNIFASYKKNSYLSNSLQYLIDLTKEYLENSYY